MVRPIDADALKDNIFHYAAPEMVWDRGDIEHKINEMPTIDAVPVVHAKWSKARLEKTYAGYTKASIYYVCSACGKDVDDALFNYCPKCGAKMDGERRDSE